jgi:hypothetical protein
MSNFYCHNFNFQLNTIGIDEDTGATQQWILRYSLRSHYVRVTTISYKKRMTNLNLSLDKVNQKLSY